MAQRVPVDPGRLLALNLGASATVGGLCHAAERRIRQADIGVNALPHESLLQLLVEVSVAFVGFSMLASVLRASVQTERARLFGFRDVAETSLIAALGSIGPLVLAAFGLPHDMTWRIASGAAG